MMFYSTQAGFPLEMNDNGSSQIEKFIGKNNHGRSPHKSRKDDFLFKAF